MRTLNFLPLFATLTTLGGCVETVTPFEPQAIDVPAATPAVGPRLSGGTDTPLLLSWMQEDETGISLLFSTYNGDTWSAPRTVVDGVEMFVNWADMPTVHGVGRDHLSAHWLEKSADLTYAYDVVFVQSFDGGMSWSAPVSPHSDGTPTEHGFVSMFADGDRTGLIWLDGRKMINEVPDDPVASGMTLRAAFMGPDSNVQDEQLVDELICDCCQTDVAVAASGPVAVYRDRTPDEIRDIYVTRFVDGKWQAGQSLSNDNWEIPGCPVNGPSITADGDQVAAAWFTGAGGEPRVKLRQSSDGGATFGDVIEVVAGKVLGRVGVVSLGNGHVAVSWLRSGENDLNEVAVQRFSGDGEPGDVHVVARGAGSFSVPQIGLSGDDLVFVWTKTDDHIDTVHSTIVPAAAL
jgi:hypothetical protein